MKYASNHEYDSRSKPFSTLQHDDYFEGEINPEDIYFLSTYESEYIINPYSADIIHLGVEVFSIFEEAYE